LLSWENSVKIYRRYKIKKGYKGEKINDKQNGNGSHNKRRT